MSFQTGSSRVPSHGYASLVAHLHDLADFLRGGRVYNHERAFAVGAGVGTVVGPGVLLDIFGEGRNVVLADDGGKVGPCCFQVRAGDIVLRGFGLRERERRGVGRGGGAEGAEIVAAQRRCDDDC